MPYWHLLFEKKKKNILQNIIFAILQRKESIAGIEQQEGE